MPERSERLAALLEDLDQQTERPAQVFVVLQEQEVDIERHGSVDRFPNLAVTVRGNPNRSLSSARNLVLRSMSSDVIVFMDDDARMASQAIEVVADAFVDQPEAAVITFRARWLSEEGWSKTYPARACRRRTARSVTSVSSIEMAASVAALNRLGVSFDERFGVGSAFATGEEFLLLIDVLRRGGIVSFLPTVIAEHAAMTSGRLLDEPMLRAKGAVFRRAFGTPGLAAIVLFVFRKMVARDLRCGPFRALRSAVRGWSELG